jgi:aminopeptidase N
MTSARRLLGVGVAALTVVAGLSPVGGAAAARAAHARPSPGGESAGDSLFPAIGNTGYDVRHYDVRLRYAAATGRMSATTAITARALHPLSRFSFDLQGLHVRRVSVDGHRAAFTRHHHKLVVTPTRAVSGRFTTTVRYGGRPVTHIDPDGSRDGWIPTPDGGATVVSEPVGAMTWFPDDNTPRDKATFDVRVDAPSSYAVAGNGDLVSRRRHAARTTWHWTQRRPMATYLAMISIGRYRVYHSTMRTTTGRRIPVWSFVAPKLGSLAHARALVPRVVRFEERRFGPYPFTSTGIVVQDLRVGYALETQNRPTFDGSPGDGTIVHELAHQWYGDSVSVRDWQDIWLNEGFATYAAALWTAAHGGPSTAQAFRDEYDSNPPSSSLWSPAPARFSDPADMFGAPVYDRGSMTLEALRERIGDRDFFTLLRRWADRHRWGNVATPQLEALAERVSGRDLSTLFRDWLLVPRRPAGY